MIKINNLEFFLEEIEKTNFFNGAILEIHREKAGKGLDHYCGSPTIKIKRKAYTDIKGKLKEIGNVCDIIYCSECKEGELIE